MDKNKRKIPGFDIFVQKIMRQLIKINFRKKSPLVLVNGLAEQYESWFFNLVPLGEHFVVQCPNFYLYNSESYLSQLPNISVDWIVERIKTYLDSYIETPPYHFVGSSSGCQSIATYAARHQEKISKIVFLCPSGLGGEENLPMVDGVSRRDLAAMITAIFHNKKNFVIDEIVQILKERFDNKKWRLGFVRMAQVTKKNCIINDLLQIKRPVLFICGEEDRIVPIWQAYRAVQQMRDHGCDVQMTVIAKCGHAPQIEQAQLTNKLIINFLSGENTKPATGKNRFLRIDNLIRQPFDLDAAVTKSAALRQKMDHLAHGVAIP